MERILRHPLPRTCATVCSALLLLVSGVIVAPQHAHASAAYDAAVTAATTALAAAKAADDDFNAKLPLLHLRTKELQPYAVKAADAQAAAADALLAVVNAANADANTANQANPKDATGVETAYQNGTKYLNMVLPLESNVHTYGGSGFLNNYPDSTANAQILNDLKRIEDDLTAGNNTLAKTALIAGHPGDAAQLANDAKTTTDASGAAGKSAADAAQECALLTAPISCLTLAAASIIHQVLIFFLLCASLFLGLAGLLFNWTIYITVFQFGNLIGNNAGMLAAWGILRDIGNILLLFGFIFMGVSTILNLPGNEFTAKKALPALIIFAVLLNFSLFAAEAVIDTSNALGSTFYRQAGNGLCPSGKSFIECATNYGISGSILQISGITKIFNPEEAKTFPNTDIPTAIAITGLTLFVTTSAAVLLAATIMLIIRACRLAFLMTVSPIGFAGMAVPFLHKFAKQWWDDLLKQSFWAPIYILLILVAIKFMDGMRTALGTSDSQTLAQVFSSTPTSNLSMVVLFILLIGFLQMATQVSIDMSAAGAGAATKFAGAAVYGGMARVTNMSLGGTARLAQYGLQHSPIRDTAFARGVTNVALKPLQGFNTDVRRLPGMGGVSKQYGAPNEHGGTYESFQHFRHEVKEKSQKNDAQYKKEVATIALRDGAAAIEKEKKKGVNADPEKLKLSPENERFLAGLSANEIAADHALLHSIEHMADQLSTAQFEGLMEHKDVSADAKRHLTENRFAEARNLANGNPNDFTNEEKAAVRRMSNKEIELMAKYDGGQFQKLMARTNASGDTLTSGKQNDHLEDSNNLTRGQRQTVRNSTRKGKIDSNATTVEEQQKIITSPTSSAAQVADARTKQADARKNLEDFAEGLGSKDKNKLSNKTITGNAEVLKSLTSDDLREFMREAKFDAAERSTIFAFVSNRANYPAGPAGQARFDDVQKYLTTDTRAAAYWS